MFNNKLVDKLDRNRMPEHIAILMDGNGRWAKKNNMPVKQGHYNGMKAMKKIIKASAKLGIKYLTVFTFSTENWNRSKLEINAIFDLIVYFVDKELKELNEANVKAGIFGDYSPLPKKAREKLDITLNKTKNNTGLNFNMCLNYGSKEEILRGISNLMLDRIENAKSLDELKQTLSCENFVNDKTAKTSSKNKLKTASSKNNKPPSTSFISDEEFKSYLYTKDLPDPDLIIRTSGEKRLSNFLLYQSAYSEFVFSEKLWPDFDGNDLVEAIVEYQKRDRRFGKRNK